MVNSMNFAYNMTAAARSKKPVIRSDIHIKENNKSQKQKK